MKVIAHGLAMVATTALDTVAVGDGLGDGEGEGDGVGEAGLP